MTDSATETMTVPPVRATDDAAAGSPLAEAAALLSGATDVTLLGHVRPDADALGSALALGRVLARRGARVRVSVGEQDEMPETLRWLDVDGLFVPASRLPESETVLVALDSASLRRLGSLAGRVAACRNAGGAVLVVDHHASNTRFGTHHLVDEGAEATALLVLGLIDALDEPLDKPIADCLYAGLVTDTGGFRRARPAVHRVAERLLDAGADPEEVSRRIMDDHPFAWLPMLASALAAARLLPTAAGGLGVVHTAVSLDVAATVRSEEVESVVDVIRSTREADVAMVLKEVAVGMWAVSLRSKGGVDVSVVARELGGGGHRRAAGCTVEGDLAAARDRVLAAVESAPLI